MFKFRAFIFVILGAALIAFYQNCGSDNYGIKVNSQKQTSLVDTNNTNNNNNNEPPISAEGGSAQQQPDPIPVPNPIPPKTTDELITSCAQAKANNVLKTETYEIVFADEGGATNNNACRWSSDGKTSSILGNLSKKDTYIRARSTQVIDLATIQDSILAQGRAVVCDMTFTNFTVPGEKFWYDDNIIITLNDYVLAATTNFKFVENSNSYFEYKNGFFKYDWARLVGDGLNPAQNGVNDTTLDKQYFAGGAQGCSECSFPVTDTQGTVKLNFSDLVIKQILGMTSVTQVKLAVTTTGDNDADTDCRHLPLRFKIDVKYY